MKQTNRWILMAVALGVLSSNGLGARVERGGEMGVSKRPGAYEPRSREQTAVHREPRGGERWEDPAGAEWRLVRKTDGQGRTIVYYAREHQGDPHTR